MASGGGIAAFSAFATTAVTMALLMFVLAILIGTAQQEVVAALKEGTPRIRRWSGAVLLVVGIWLIALAVWADFFARFFPV